MPDDEPDKPCCGNCRNWDQSRYTGRDAYGDCTISIPPCLNGPKYMTRNSMGAECPAFQERGATDE